MALLNQAYQNSNISLTARLVHTALVDYTETGNMSDALYAVTNGEVFTPAPNAVNVHDLRNTYGADFVAMFTNDSNYCGIAWIMTYERVGFNTHAYSVTLP
jgi:hypothetical protein